MKWIKTNGSVKNKTLLISGGAGAVGFYGIQIAKLAGANVITTISNDEKAKIANNAGADKVINYKNQNVFEEVMEYTNSNGVDRIFEVEFGGNLPLNEKIIKPNGVIAAYGSMAKMEPKLPFYNLMFKGVKIDTFLIYSIENKFREEILTGLSELLNQNILLITSYKSPHLVDQYFVKFLLKPLLSLYQMHLFLSQEIILILIADLGLLLSFLPGLERDSEHHQDQLPHYYCHLWIQSLNRIHLP